VILEEHCELPEMVRRFVEEAQIGGQLQHPGIVPVYELGQFPDGRLYIAMKLVRGRTLAALLENRKGPEDDRARFLSIFEQVCQTMAYAHSRGVVHRDLKPSNVMVGSFGEVQVMDWGLAKVLDQGGVADELRAQRGRDDTSAIRTVRTGSAVGESLAGSVLGTPAYMAPEQARGAIDTLDERADVFGLGSILCEILSGQPAYSGQKGLALYRMAERADLRDAFDRLDACGADAELVALVKSCLAPAPKDRPRDAGVVLAGLSAYFTGAERRLREAGLAQAKAETLAAEERKRRVLAVALASSLLVTGLLGAGGWVWVTRDRLQVAQAVSLEVDKALDVAATMREKARSATVDDPTLWIQAIEAARRAESLLPRGETSPELRQRVRSVLAAVEHERDEAEAVEKDRRMVERLAGIHNDLGVHGDIEQADSEYAAAFRGYGVDLDALDPEVAGAQLAASPVAPELANALDQWAFIRRGPHSRDEAGAWRLVTIAKTADPDPWRNRLRDTLGRMNEDRGRSLEALERLAATADLDRLPEASVTRLAFALASMQRREMAIALLRRTQRAHPDDFWVNADLGRELMFSGQPDAAVRFFAVAVGVRPQSGLALYSLGTALQRSGQLTEAADTFRRLIALRPDDAHARVSLGTVLITLGERRTGEVEFREAMRLKPDDWIVRDLIVNARLDQGDWDAAVEERREAVRREPSLSFTHKDLGRTLFDAGRTDEAVDAFREAIRLDPRLSQAQLGLARALLARGEFEAARDALAQSQGSPPSRGRGGPPPQGRGGPPPQGRGGPSHQGRSGPPSPGRGDPPSPSPAELARKAQRMIALDARLPALLRGEDHPADAAECVEFAQLCFCRQVYATSALLWSEAFAAQPGLADDLGAESRYQAARAAALAGCGRGKDEPPPDLAARKRWREQALDWLRADLMTVAGLLDKGTPRQRTDVPRRLGRWRVDPALAGIRDEAAMATLPETERRACRDLWSRVLERMKNEE
jgi:serine/threonine-protein kinase